MSEPHNLKESVAKGFFWAAISNGAQQVVMMLIGIVLARLLDEADYGMVAMLTVFSVIAANLQEGGFYNALAVRKEARHEDFNAVFWFNVLMSAAIYVILFFTVPLIADFNHTPQLVPLGRVLFLGFVITGLGTAQAAWLFRNLMVKQKTTSQVKASLFSGLVGLAAAWWGAGCWSLVYMDLSYKAAYVLLVWHYSPWRPTLQINFRPALQMFGFGSRMLVTNLLMVVNNQLLQTLLGHFYPAGQVGQYSQANKWNTMGSTLLTGMVGSVAQPALAKVGDEEGRQLRIFRKMLRFTAFFSFPALLGLGLVAPEFIFITIGSKWMECVPYLQTLCVAGAFIPINQMFSNLLISQEKSGIYLASATAFLLCQLAAVVVLYPYGIGTLLYAVSGLNVAWLGIWFVIVHREVGLRFRHLLADIVPFLLLALLSLAAAGCAASFFSVPLVVLFVKVIVTIVVYALCMHFSGAEIWKECLAFFLGKFRKR